MSHPACVFVPGSLCLGLTAGGGGVRGRGGVEGNARRVCTPPKVVPKARIWRSGGCRGTGVISGTRGWEGSGEGGWGTGPPGRRGCACLCTPTPRPPAVSKKHRPPLLHTTEHAWVWVGNQHAHPLVSCDSLAAPHSCFLTMFLFLSPPPPPLRPTPQHPRLWCGRPPFGRPVPPRYPSHPLLPYSVVNPPPPFVAARGQVSPGGQALAET